MWRIVFYLAFIYFIAIGFYRWFKYGAKQELLSVAVGCFGIVVLLLNDYGGFVVVPSSPFREAYDLACAFLDLLLALSVIYLMIKEFRRK
jgi:hypothetical protein